MAAARWTTVWTPRSALRNDAGSDRSPSTICTRTRSLPRRRWSRTSTRTRSPFAVSRRRTWEPTFPVAPVRRIIRLEPMPLLGPGVGVVVVAVQLPEAHPVLAHHLELAQELRRLPEVALRHEQSQRGAVVGLERLAGEGVGDHHIVVLERLEGDVGGVAAVGVGHHLGARRLHARAAERIDHGDPAPGGVELRPAGDAVDVGHDLALGQGTQLVPGQPELVLDLAEHAQIPRREVETRVRAYRQDREALGQVLARRHAVRVDPQLLGLSPAALGQHPRGDRHERDLSDPGATVGYRYSRELPPLSPRGNESI